MASSANIIYGRVASLRTKRNDKHFFWKIDVCLETDGHDYSVCYKKKICGKKKAP